MRNRRLNVLFIALLALFAAPQALLDVHRLANAAQERAESEFWSIFLSYQMPDNNGGGRPVTGREIVSAPHNEGAGSACPLQQMVASRTGAARVIVPSNNNARSRARASADGVRESADQTASAPETANSELDNDEADEDVAATYTVPAITFTEREQKALKSAALHARDAEKIASIAQRAALASFIQQDVNVRIKTRQLMDMDRALRTKTRNRDRMETPDAMSLPGPVGSM